MSGSHETLQGFLRHHPLLAQRTKFAAFARGRDSFRWFVGP